MLLVLPVAGCQERQPEPVPETKTYTNSEFGFSVKYPRHWEAAEYSCLQRWLYLEEGQGLTPVMFGPEEPSDYTLISITIYKRATQWKTLEDCYESYKQAWATDPDSGEIIRDPNQLAISYTQIAGLPAIIITYSSDDSPREARLVFFKDGVAFDITYSTDPAFYQQNFYYFELIINSFEFD
jgi:hypothetical protein